MSLQLGINVREVDGNLAPSIQAAPTSNTGFVIRAVRGVPGTVQERAQRVTSWRQFERRFGSFRKNTYGAYCIKGFFDNGGSVAYVVRVVDKNSAQAAELELEGSGITIRAGRRGKEDPGGWGNALSVRVDRNESDGGDGDQGDGDQGDGDGDGGDEEGGGDAGKTFTLTVFKDGEVVETWEDLSVEDEPADGARNIVEAINDEDTGSDFIFIMVELGESPTIPPDTGVDEEEELGNGTDPELSEEDAPKAYSDAFALFETVPIQLLCCPESTEREVVEAGLEHCEERGDAMFVGHSVKDRDAEATEGYGRGFRGTKRLGALYFPWIKVADPLGGRKLIPPTGHVLGVYARKARQRGVWKAPAGSAARLRGALDVAHHITDATHTDLVKEGSVNAVRFIQGAGIVVDSSRTLSTSPLWLYVNVRLLVNFIKTSLVEGLRWVVQEPNDETLWNKVKYNTVTPFLSGLWSRGAFGPGSPEEVFTVKCDEDTNTPENIQQGRFNVEVYIAPSRPAETIVLTIGQQEGGGSSSES